jgi:DNA-binding Xre family transcriptional regulator
MALSAARSDVNMIERINVNHLAKICEVLGCEPGDILKLEKHKHL